MDPLEFIGPIRAYPAVPHPGGIMETLLTLGLAVVAIAIVTGLAIKSAVPY